MKKALILGCSHAAGSEMGTDKYGRANSYPVLLAERMGYTAHNGAIAGGSNDAIFRIFEAEYKNYNIIIACWSGYNRTEVWHDNAWIPFVPGGNAVDLDLDKYFQQWILHQTDAVTGRLNKIKNILALNAIAQAHNVTVINIDSFWPVTNIVWPSGIHWPVLINFWDWANAQGFNCTAWGHFQKDAHSAFADYILENIAN
tara:strand:+ start:199 stop:798 length:600 start_codon:yes stop_codon:yes gene_type:complete